MNYRVVLTNNGQYKKTLHRCKTRETAFINFNLLKAANKVLFPQQFVNTKGIKPVKYQICVTKVTEDGDTFRILRNAAGKTYTEKPLGDWTILHSDEYNIEERFWFYGLDPRKERPTIKEIIKKLAIGAYKKNMVRQVIIVHNKLVVYNEDHFDMIICKCKQDAQRLHYALAEACRKQKIKSFIFMGTARQVMISRLYDLIKEKTGWPITKIWRTTTRP